MINGIIPVNKPAGFTSFDVIAKMRGILKIKRLGHAGTLDPMATGVLPVFVGTATKACDILPESDKTYEAGFILGIRTDTQDTTGNVVESVQPSAAKEDIERVLVNFRGNIKQVPPMYSAVSVGGKRLYELARKGIEVEREAREVFISELTLTEFDAEKQCGKLRISCSKGTYVRTIINDIGEELSCGAAMSSLVRTMAAGFTLEECVTLEQLQAADDFTGMIVPIERVFEDYPKIMLSEIQTKMYKNGIRLDLNRLGNIPDAEIYTVFGNGEFLGTARADRDNRELVIHKNFYGR